MAELKIGDMVTKDIWDVTGRIIETDSSKMKKADREGCVNPDDFIHVEYPLPTGKEWTNKDLLIKV